MILNRTGYLLQGFEERKKESMKFDQAEHREAVSLKFSFITML